MACCQVVQPKLKEKPCIFSLEHTIKRLCSGKVGAERETLNAERRMQKAKGGRRKAEGKRQKTEGKIQKQNAERKTQNTKRKTQNAKAELETHFLLVLISCPKSREDATEGTAGISRASVQHSAFSVSITCYQ
jgi:hypothetical protein